MNTQSVTLNLDDRLLRLIEVALFEAYNLNETFRIILRTADFEDVAFNTPGMPVRIRFDSPVDRGDDIFEAEEPLLETMRRGLDGARAIVIVGAEAEEAGSTP